MSNARVLDLSYRGQRLRCICGRRIQAHDFQLDEDRIRLDCTECFAQLFTIELLAEAGE
jgi:hypothetical protein